MHARGTLSRSIIYFSVGSLNTRRKMPLFSFWHRPLFLLMPLLTDNYICPELPESIMTLILGLHWFGRIGVLFSTDGSVRK
jgi:hypothetical protein